MEIMLSMAELGFLKAAARRARLGECRIGGALRDAVRNEDGGTASIRLDEAQAEALARAVLEEAGGTETGTGRSVLAKLAGTA